MQGSEHFGSIDAEKPLVATLDIKKAEPPFGYQFKFLGGVSYTLKRPKGTWNVSLDADITALKAGIGRDYTIALRLDAAF